jgi:cytoskeletal protein CcmA (bactofilin family)
MFKRKEEINLSTQEIRTLISVGCIFEGSITVPEGLTRIDGEIIGNVSGKGGLIVGEKGFIKGNVDIMEIVIYGRVEGDIIAKSVELKTGSRVDGNITTSDLVIEKGAIYNGQCRMEQVKKGAQAPSG